MAPQPSRCPPPQSPCPPELSDDVLVAAAVITSFVDFLISFVILAVLMLWYQ